jgi:N-acetylglucosamine-6-phosphate deacetylase
MKTLIKNTRILLEDSVLYDHQVVIEDNLISRIISKEETVKDIDKVIDGKNLYLSPGFIDIHNHGNSGFDTMDATQEALENMAKYHLSNGVTTFLAATMTNPKDKILKAAKNVADYMETQTEENSRLLGIYLEGPYFNILKKGAQPGQAIKDPDIEEVKEFIETSKNTIKVVSLAPELKGAKEMIKYLRNNDIKIAIGHSNSEYESANQAITLGATISTHLYNGMRAYTHREPGIIGACLTNSLLRTEIIADGIHLHKTAIEVAKLCKGCDNIILISDAMRAAGLEDGMYELGGQTVISKDGSARLLDGALAGSTLNLNLAVKNMINLFDTSIVNAVKMASLNPAKAIGLEEKLGSISAGKYADLLFFDDSVEIKHIIKDGILLK